MIFTRQFQNGTHDSENRRYIIIVGKNIFHCWTYWISSINTITMIIYGGRSYGKTYKLKQFIAMNIRQQIIERLDKPVSIIEEYKEYHYNRLKLCLNTIPEQCGSKMIDIDLWFKGVIHSLYYRPNKYVLVLEGEQGIGKSEFFRRLFWNHYVETSDTKILQHLIYDNLVIQFDEGMEKKHLNLPMEDNYIINQVANPFLSTNGDLLNPECVVCDKRLASYCCTTNKWQFPQRKNYIILHLESINQELYNSIDKELLWIEIFNKFKPEGK